jgi:hypothetical protein
MANSVYGAVTGMQDAFLSDEPDYTYFNNQVSQGVSYATETYALPFDTQDNRISTIPLKGEFISDITIKMTLPGLVNTDDNYWTYIDPPPGNLTFYGNRWSYQPISQIKPREISVYDINNLNSILPNVSLFATGPDFSLISTSTSLYVCGDNSAGQLGLGNITSSNIYSLTQVQLPSGVLFPIISLDCGGKHSAIIDSNNNLWVSGDNSFGQLGLANSSNTFVQTGSGNYISVKCNNFTTIVLDISKTVYGTGTCFKGELGLGNDYQYLTTFTTLTTLPTSIDVIQTGTYCTFFVNNSNQEIYSCGDNSYGKLGINSLDSTKNTPTACVIQDTISFPINQIHCGSDYSAIIATVLNNINFEIPISFNRCTSNLFCWQHDHDIYYVNNSDIYDYNFNIIYTEPSGLIGDLTLGPGGTNLYYTIPSTGSVNLYDLTSGSVSTIATGLDNPTGISCDHNPKEMVTNITGNDESGVFLDLTSQTLQKLLLCGSTLVGYYLTFNNFEYFPTGMVRGENYYITTPIDLVTGYVSFGYPYFSSIQSGLTSTTGICVLTQNNIYELVPLPYNLYVCTGTTITQIDQNYNVSTIASGFISLGYIVVEYTYNNHLYFTDGDGSVYVLDRTNSNSIYKIYNFPTAPLYISYDHNGYNIFVSLESSTYMIDICTYKPVLFPVYVILFYANQTSIQDYDYVNIITNNQSIRVGNTSEFYFSGNTKGIVNDNYDSFKTFTAYSGNISSAYVNKYSPNICILGGLGDSLINDNERKNNIFLNIYQIQYPNSVQYGQSFINLCLKNAYIDKTTYLPVLPFPNFYILGKNFIQGDLTNSKMFVGSLGGSVSQEILSIPKLINNKFVFSLPFNTNDGFGYSPPEKNLYFPPIYNCIVFDSLDVATFFGFEADNLTSLPDGTFYIEKRSISYDPNEFTGTLTLKQIGFLQGYPSSGIPIVSQYQYPAWNSIINSVNLYMGKQLIQKIPSEFLKFKKEISNSFKNRPILDLLEGNGQNIVPEYTSYYIYTDLLNNIPIHATQNQDVQLVIDHTEISNMGLSAIITYVKFRKPINNTDYLIAVPQVSTSFPKNPCTKIFTSGTFNTLKFNGEFMFDSDSSNVASYINFLNVPITGNSVVFNGPINLSRIRDIDVYAPNSNVYYETLNVLKISGGISGLLFS